MVQEIIDKLIPYINENFITYPLWEEGKYIPFVNFWQKIESLDDEIHLDEKLKLKFKETGYSVFFNDTNSSNTILEYSICPNYFELNNGSYEFEKKDWSIEEILELLTECILN